MKKLEVAAAAENLDTVLEFLNEQLAEIGCSAAAQMQIELAVEEVFVNIASYAYYPETGAVTVQVETKPDRPEIAVTFIDSGVPYNPLEKADPDVTLSADEREIGGLGIFLTKKTMDHVVYEYRDGKNVLTIEKKVKRQT